MFEFCSRFATRQPLEAEEAFEKRQIMLKRIIGVMEHPPLERYGVVFDALRQLYPVEFRPVRESDYNGLDALIVLDGNLVAGLAAAAGGLPAYVVVEGKTDGGKLSGSEVRFGQSSSLDEYLRGQVMREEHPEPFSPLTAQSDDEVLALLGGHPVWLNRPVGRSHCQMVSLPPPPMQPGEFLFRHLNAPGFMRLLPLLDFLRHVVKKVDWQDVPPRACFIFDDPSLYHPTYGFIDYRLLAEHATRHDYYASVATVPLDTWWVNPAVAKTFRSFSPRLSLLVHGNNHTSHELHSPNSANGQLAMVAQAVRRMRRLELDHQIPFLRIMEPPHAMIAYEMFAPLLALGFEAVLGTTELLVRHNPRIPWPVIVGMERSELLGGGLPVIPRIRMSPNWKNEVLIAAFLRQPIILAGHHIDAMDHLELLADFARLINHFKSVVWGSPLEIARSNYKVLRQGDVLNIKAYSRRFLVPVPEGVGSLCIHRPWLRAGADDEIIIVNSGGREIFRGPGPDVPGRIPFTAPGMIEVCCPSANVIDYQIMKAPKPNLWPVMRKILTEFRDRSAPWRHRVARFLPSRGAMSARKIAED
jgi:hypothetical protein